MLASEPREQHVLMAEQVEDATNGLLSTLSKSDICTVASPGKAFQAEKVWPRPGRSRVGTVPRGKRSGGSPGRGEGKRSGVSQLQLWGALLGLPPCVEPCGFSARNPELVAEG